MALRGNRAKMLAQAQQTAAATSGFGGSSGGEGFPDGSGRGVGGFPERDGGGGGDIPDRGGGGFVTKDADVEARPLEPPRPLPLPAPLQCFSASSDSSIAKDMLKESSKHYAKMSNTTICTLCNVLMHGWAPDWEMHFRSSAHKNKVRQQKKEAPAAGWREEEPLRQEEESLPQEEEPLRQEEEPLPQPQQMEEEESPTASRQERIEARARAIEAGSWTPPLSWTAFRDVAWTTFFEESACFEECESEELPAHEEAALKPFYHNSRRQTKAASGQEEEAAAASLRVEKQL